MSTTRIDASGSSAPFPIDTMQRCKTLKSVFLEINPTVSVSRYFRGSHSHYDKSAPEIDEDFRRFLYLSSLCNIIFGDTVLEKQLNDFKNKERDICEELKFITERLNYYVLSLPPLIRKGDEYKYFFHNNIIVHEYVKLKAILAGVIDYNYLPRMAKQYLTEDEWNKIIYSFGDDMIKHYEKVKLLSDEIIRITNQRYSL